MARNRPSEAPTAPTGKQRRPSLRRIAGFLADSESGRFDRLIYERVRLGILSALAVRGRTRFTELRDLLEVTDGNLSVHARKLEGAGYLKVIKRFEGRTPRTEFELTSQGRKALTRYLDHMEALIEATRGD